MRSSEGWRFGGRANENARDWLWEELVAWAAKSISFICFPWSWYRWHTLPPWQTLQKPAEDIGSGPQKLDARLQKSAEVRSRAGRTYVEFLISLKLVHDFLSDLVLRDAQVLPDVAVVAHQGHVVISNVEQLRQRNSNTGSHQSTTLAFGEEPSAAAGEARHVRSCWGDLED